MQGVLFGIRAVASSRLCGDVAGFGSARDSCEGLLLSRFGTVAAVRHLMGVDCCDPGLGQGGASYI